MQIQASLGPTKFNWLFLEDVEGQLEITGDSLCSYNQFLKIMTGETFDIVPTQYQRLSELFVSSSFVAPILMPKNELKQGLKKAENMLKKAVTSSEDICYLKNWSKIINFLGSMKSAKIDRDALEFLMKENDSELSKNFLSFMPDASGFAKKVKYNTCDGITGRIKVSSGPRILTSTHEVRNCLRSSYEKGSVISVDFTSVEPRIAMIATNKQAPEDVYLDLLEEFPELDRQVAKIATLAALYGSKANKLSEVVGSLDQARKAISFVRAHFRVENLERMLEVQASGGLVRNLIGRPLREATKNPRIRTNHFLQSSAAELSIMLFSDLCEKFHDGIRPLFIIHDALLVDIREDVLELFCEEAQSITWHDSPMPVKIETLSHT